jgi:hypothetical protein
MNFVSPARFVSLACGLMLALSLMAAPGTADAFCCPAVDEIQLQAVAGAPVRLRGGKSEINECLGMSFLHVVVRGNVADGTVFYPVFRSLTQPIIGNAIVMVNGRGEAVMEGVTLGEVLGKTLSITDDSLTDDLLIGQF